MGSSLRSGRNCKWGVYSALSTFNTTTEVPLMCPGHRSINGCPLPRVCVHCCVCVHFGWDKCRAQIPSMGYDTLPRHFHFTYVNNVSNVCMRICCLRFYLNVNSVSAYIRWMCCLRWTTDVTCIILTMSLLSFWALIVLGSLLSMDGQRALRIHQKYLNLCSEDEWKSYSFGTTWGWVINDRISILGWTIP